MKFLFIQDDAQNDQIRAYEEQKNLVNSVNPVKKARPKGVITDL